MKISVNFNNLSDLNMCETIFFFNFTIRSHWCPQANIPKFKRESVNALYIWSLAHIGKKCFSLFKMPTCFDILLAILLMQAFQLRFSFIIKHRENETL